jgi:hypothetical protein
MFAQHTRKNFFEKVTDGMKSHYIVQPRQFQRAEDDSWMEVEEEQQRQ